MDLDIFSMVEISQNIGMGIKRQDVTSVFLCFSEVLTQYSPAVFSSSTLIFEILSILYKVCSVLFYPTPYHYTQVIQHQTIHTKQYNWLARHPRKSDPSANRIGWGCAWHSLAVEEGALLPAPLIVARLVAPPEGARNFQKCCFPD